MDEPDERAARRIESCPKGRRLSLELMGERGQRIGDLRHVADDGVGNRARPLGCGAANCHLADEAGDGSARFVGARTDDLALGASEADEGGVRAARGVGPPSSGRCRVFGIGHRACVGRGGIRRACLDHGVRRACVGHPPNATYSGHPDRVRVALVVR